MVGLFEPVCAPWKVGGVPEDFSFGEIPPDWDRMGPYVEKAMQRVPISIEVGVKKFFCGPESFTPDLAADRRRGAGAEELLRRRRAQLDRHPHRRRPRSRARALDHQRPARRRRHRHQHRSPAHVPGEPRVPPHAHRRVARHGLPVPLPDALDADRARREAVAVPRSARRARRVLPRRQRLGGRRLVRAAGKRRRSSELSWGRQSWFPHWAGRAPRRARGRDPDGHVVHGEVPRRRDATPGGCSNWISANNVDGAAGQITYTQWLDEAGKLQADLTVTKLDDERFWVVASDTAHRHVETWMRRHIPSDAHAFVADVTSALRAAQRPGPALARADAAR